MPIYSVYGETDAKRRPPPEVIRNLDVIVVDLQDIGARFYTYETTVGYFLEAAAKAKKPIIVLDRPNPITGNYVQGPISDAGQESFVNYFALPVRHGMTIGELAKLFNEEKQIDADLTVVPMRGWLRGDWYDSTGAHVGRSLAEYSKPESGGAVSRSRADRRDERSVGRGTDMPFEQIGSPYFIAKKSRLISTGATLAACALCPFHSRRPVGPFARRECFGVNIIVTNREQLDAPELGLELAAALHKLYPLGYDLGKMNQLLVNQATFKALQAGQDPHRIQESWQDQLETFMDLRQKYLMY